MSLKEDLTKLIMEAYDRGVKDTQQTAFAALEQAYDRGAAAEREACAKVCVNLEDADIFTLNKCAAAIRARGNA